MAMDSIEQLQTPSKEEGVFSPQHAAHHTHNLRSRLARLVGDALGMTIEGIAAILIVAEVVILFIGVVARYFLHAPQAWADETASILFLWLGCIGAVVAFRRVEHMRMTALVSMAQPRAQAFLETFAITATLAFLLMIAAPSFEYAIDELPVATPALELSNAWRAFAMPVAVGFMVILGFARLMRVGHRKVSFTVLLSTVAICLAFYFAKPALLTLGNINLVIFFTIVPAILVLTGVPIAVAFGLATAGFLSLTTKMPMTVLVGRMQEGMSHSILLAIPLFVFLGLLLEMTGMARAMVTFLASLLGHIRGGLSYVLVGAMYLVSGISGSKAADMAAVAPVLFPEMKKRGAKHGDLVALLAATGAQTETIPPSLVLITIGSVTSVSIAALFTGGLLPAVILGLTLCVLVGWRYRNEDLSQVKKATRKEIGKAFIVALPALALPFIIRAAVIEGVATATEVSTVGIAYALLTGLLIYRSSVNWRRLYPMLIETAALSGAILFIIGTATGMSWALTQSGFSQNLAKAMSDLPGGSDMFLAVSILAFIVLGSVLEGIPAIVLFGPLLFPIAHQMGIHEVHYAMVVVLAMGVGLFAPPFGIGYYAACAIGKVSPDEGMKPIIGYIIALLVGLGIVAVFPWISIGFL